MIRYGKLEANYVDRGDAYKAHEHLPKCPRCHYPVKSRVCLSCADTSVFDTSSSTYDGAHEPRNWLARKVI